MIKIAMENPSPGGMLSTLAHLVPDPVFILWLHLGAGGAAAATVLENAIAVAYHLIYSARRDCHIDYRRYGGLLLSENRLPENGRRIGFFLILHCFISFYVRGTLSTKSQNRKYCIK